MAFSEDCLKAVLDAYPPIVDKHKDDDYTEQEKQWQLMRRGRYVDPILYVMYGCSPLSLKVLFFGSV